MKLNSGVSFVRIGGDCHPLIATEVTTMKLGLTNQGFHAENLMFYINGTLCGYSIAAPKIQHYTFQDIVAEYELQNKKKRRLLFKSWWGLISFCSLLSPVCTASVLHSNQHFYGDKASQAPSPIHDYNPNEK